MENPHDEKFPRPPRKKGQNLWSCLSPWPTLYAFVGVTEDIYMAPLLTLPFLIAPNSNIMQKTVSKKEENKTLPPTEFMADNDYVPISELHRYAQYMANLQLLQRFRLSLQNGREGKGIIIHWTIPVVEKWAVYSPHPSSTSYYQTISIQSENKSLLVPTQKWLHWPVAASQAGTSILMDKQQEKVEILKTLSFKQWWTAHISPPRLEGRWNTDLKLQHVSWRKWK